MGLGLGLVILVACLDRRLLGLHLLRSCRFEDVFLQHCLPPEEDCDSATWSNWQLFAALLVRRDDDG